MRSRLISSLAAAGLALGATATAVAQSSAKPEAYTMPGAEVYPEGIARQAGSSAFFVGSTSDGTIFRGDVRSPRMEVLAAPGANGRSTAIGLKEDGRGRLVVAGGPTGKVFVLSAKDGRTLKVLDTKPSGADTFLNDVVISKGYAYITDSQRPVLFRVRLAGSAIGKVERFRSFTGTAFRYQPGFNANGIAASSNGRYLVVVQSGTGKLFRVDVRTRRVTEIALRGRTVKNGDGLLLRGSTLYVARNMQELIVPIRLVDGGRRGIVGTGATGPQLKYPTTIAFDGDRLLAVNSQFDKRSAMKAPEVPFDVATLPVPRAPAAPRQ